jgi:AraC-like DNA-binding protein
MRAARQTLPRIVNFFRFRHDPGWRIEVAKPRYGTLTYVIDGVVRYVIEGRWVAVPAGSAAMMRAGIDKRGAVGLRSQAAGYSVHFDLPPRVEFPAIGPPSVMRPGLDSDLLALFEELDATWLEKEDEAPPLRAEGLFLLVLARLQRLAASGTGQGDRRVETIKRRLLEHMAAPVDSEAIARSVGLSPVYMGLLFKRETGLSLRNYANRLRVRRALNMLRAGTFSVSEVAAQCGFEDLYYFSRVFKRWTGVPPTEVLRRGERSAD